jgi:hypothetical protein
MTNEETNTRTHFYCDFVLSSTFPFRYRRTVGIFAIIGLFFTTITNPKAIEQRASSSQSRTFAQRNGGRSYRDPSSRRNGGSGGQTLGRRPGANIRGVRDLGSADCAVGGG